MSVVIKLPAKTTRRMAIKLFDIFYNIIIKQNNNKNSLVLVSLGKVHLTIGNWQLNGNA
jgi:hypothetical protein